MPKRSASDTGNIHQHTDHQHGETCGCKTVRHGDRVDYVHDGNVHRIHGKADERLNAAKPKPTPTLSDPEALSDLDLAEGKPEADEEQEIIDSNFRSELDYDGYRSIEEADNDAYGSRDLERNEEPPGGLRIVDREKAPESGEESLIDPQENRK